MPDDPQRAVETMRNKLDSGEYDITDADREILLELDRTIQLLGPSEVGTHQHEFLLRRNLKLAKDVGGLAAALEDRSAAEDLVTWIHRKQNGSPETNKDYRVALRNFGKHVTDGDNPPETLEWIPGGYPSDYDPAPDPANMLKWDGDVLPMVEACHNSRDRALITLAWDLGPRPGELFDLTPNDITSHKYGLQVTLDGKTGQRSPVLIPSVPYVRRWLDDHPGNGSDPLWCGLNTGDSITNNRIRDALKDAADRAGVDKPVTPTNFRKSSASYLASQNVSQAHLEDHHGWTRGSDIAARYIAVFDDANEREIARAHGMDVEADEPDAVGPIICPRCEQKTPREKDACVWCDHVLSQQAAEEIEAQRQSAVTGMPKADRDVQEALATIESELGDDVSIRVEMLDE
ncbi:tyrosine-type recombinase/integrase [Halovenus marina]|uniref:tyrosine-type recombinase/integrase n=1 Tax=Halovenus marina TaxID=3396621 RepID=UPI003F55496B